MTTDIHAESVFCDLINRGNLTYPTQVLLDQVKKMYEIFCAHNKDYTIQAKLYIPSTINTQKKLVLLLLFSRFGFQGSTKCLYESEKSVNFGFKCTFLVQVRINIYNKLALKKG